MDNQSNATSKTPVGSNQSPHQVEVETLAPMDSQAYSPVHDDEEEHAPSTNTKVGSKRKVTSLVWNHFMLQKINGKDKAICNYCKKTLGGESKNGTRHLHDHFKRCPLRPMRDIGQEAIQVGKSKKDGKCWMSNYHFDQEVSRKKLARMIIMHEYPLSIVDHHEFREYTSSLQPLFKVPTRNTIKGDVLSIYEQERGNVMRKLKKNSSRVALTTDMWTSNQKKGYMAITAHYIDDDWKMESRIIRFVYVPCPHTSEALGKVLHDCMLDWMVDEKLSTVTVDNCSTNDAIIRLLLNKIPCSSLLLEGSLLHMRCCAHILNLIVQDGLSIIKQGIEKVRDTVAFWSGSQKRVEKFEEQARQLEIQCTKKLSLDCKTRWNSTYLMLTVALEYKDVFKRLEVREDDFKCCPTDTEWDVAEEVCSKLHIFYEVTEKYSGSKYPTSNIFFPYMCRIRSALFSWQASSSEMIKSMSDSMIQKFEKYWSKTHGVMTIAVILDPRYKMKVLEFYYKRHYGPESGVEIEKVRAMCSKLLVEYQERESKTKQKRSATQTYEKEISQSRLADLDDVEFETYVSVASEGLSRSELDHYLEETLVPRTVEFDILVWWKTNGFKWPTLQKMARDILAIPVSTVASESAFSGGGRTVNPQRSRLHSNTVEALMCTQSWLWNDLQDNPAMDVGGLYRSIEDDEDDEEGSAMIDTNV